GGHGGSGRWSMRRARSQPRRAAAIGAAAGSGRRTEPALTRTPPLPVFVCTTYNHGVPHDASPYPRATREAGRQTRRALLDAAARLFAEHGVAGVSAAEIARE